ncbi:MAG: type IV pilus twitching motility protein PilT [Candidatus Xenobia bacterium]
MPPQQPPSGHFGPAPAPPIDGISDDAPPLVPDTPMRRLPLEKVEKAALPPVPEPVETKRRIPGLQSLGLPERAPAPEVRAADLPFAGVLTLDGLLASALAANASDLHLASGRACSLRIGGDLQIMAMPPLSRDQVQQILFPLLRQDQMEQYRSTGNLDFIYEAPGGARFRVNVFAQHHGMAATFRAIPIALPSIEELELPAVAELVLAGGGGLLILAGRPGSGRSTTLAALIAHFNRSRPGHVICLEDPIEYVHAEDQSLVDQREIGLHALSFEDGVRVAARQAPDLLAVGDMQDPAVIEAALAAAEQGVMVVGVTLAHSPARVVPRLLDEFEPDRQKRVRQRLQQVLRGVVVQRLESRPGGRVAVHEYLAGAAALS